MELYCMSVATENELWGGKNETEYESGFESGFFL